MAGKDAGKALMIFLKNREVLEALEDGERGQLILALLDYQEYGLLPEFSGAMKMAFLILRKDVDQNLARWNESCARRSAAGKKSAAVRAAKNFPDGVSCEQDIDAEEAQEDFFAPEPRQAAAQDNAEQPEASGSRGEQREASFRNVEQREASCSNVEQTEALFNHVQQRAAASTYSNTNSSSSSNSRSNSNSLSSPAGGRGREADFNRFWTAYPRKVGKQAARRAFERVGLPVEQLLTALEQQRKDPQWHRENGRFIPHPATWLTQGRWEDETAPGPQDCGAYGVECL